MRKGQLFNEVPVMKVNRNLFDLSHEVKMSGKFGYLYPVLLMDCLPGDTIREKMTVNARFAPLLAPVMHRVDVKTHFFFVPNRLLSDHWENFITGGQDGTMNPVLPYITPAALIDSAAERADLMRKGTLWDYFGLPVLDGAVPVSPSTQQFSILPFRAYQKIWNDWYRDPNFDVEEGLNLEMEGEVSAQQYDMLFIKRKSWEKDMNTSQLPWPQRGAEVLMPLSGTGTVTYRNATNVYRADDGLPVAGQGIETTGTSFMSFDGADSPLAARFENIDEINLDSSDVSINDLRRALALQRWLENNARGGGRYIEQIESHFNQRVPDYRLQRSEYLGGGSQPVVISEVLSTADSEDVPVGDMAGHGQSVGKTNQFTYRCQEHGWVIGIMSVVPRTAYQQGIDRMWMRQSRFDYAWPELARIGEQEMYSKEVYFSFNDDDTVNNDETFGYLPRYAEYKFKNDRVSGDFRDTLSFWHLGRIFSQRPTLDAQFTTMYEDSLYEETFRRIFAVQDGTDYLWFQLFHHLTAKRPLPYFGVPSIS